MSDNLVLSVEEIAERYVVPVGTLRAWIAAGKLQPVERAGQGRSGRMWFSVGSVHAVLYAGCPVCGNGFRRTTLRSVYCSPACRKRAARSRG